MKLTPVYIDLETYWSADHSLTKLNPIVYCTHPETEVISCAVKVGNDSTQVVFGESNIQQHLRSIDWSNKIVIGHNLSGFDSMILRWRFGVDPAMWGCTLAMSRPLHGLDVGGSLAKLVEHYKIGVKDQTALINTKGKHLKDFTPEELAAMEQYNKNDVEQCAALFKILLPLTPKNEMKLIDMTVRMLVEPKFDVDVELLEMTLARERERKHAMLLDIAAMIGAKTTDKSDDEIVEEIAKILGSAQKFAKLLQDLGVEPPKKISPTTGKETYALAKTDEEFIALIDHHNPVIAAAASARLGVKSTLLETRIQSFLEVARATNGKMPIFLNYYAAHTGRWGGGASLNQQNLPRVSRDKDGNITDKPTNALRLSLVAPPGHKVVVADLSGIELRVNHFLWQVPSSMALFKQDPEADLYRAFAAARYGIKPDEVSKEQRQLAKVAQLGLGFGSGWTTFQRVAKLMGGLELSDEEAQSIVADWRAAYPEIVHGWKLCHAALTAIDQGASYTIDPWGMCTTVTGGIRLPSGRVIRYPKLRQEATSEGGTEWVYGEGRNKARIYAGKITENIVQALARDVLVNVALKVKKETNYWPCHSVHDELVYIVPEEEAESILGIVHRYMRTPPDWWPELVTWSEGDIANSYGEAK